MLLRLKYLKHYGPNHVSRYFILFMFVIRPADKCSVPPQLLPPIFLPLSPVWSSAGRVQGRWGGKPGELRGAIIESGNKGLVTAVVSNCDSDISTLYTVFKEGLLATCP